MAYEEDREQNHVPAEMNRIESSWYSEWQDRKLVCLGFIKDILFTIITFLTDTKG